jgi:hypothetical protein
VSVDTSEEAVLSLSLMPCLRGQSPPRVNALHAGDVPIYTSPSGARVRVIAGETTDGVASPLNDDLLTKVGRGVGTCLSGVGWGVPKPSLLGTQGRGILFGVPPAPH